MAEMDIRLPPSPRRPMAAACALLCMFAAIALPASVAWWLWQHPIAQWLPLAVPTPPQGMEGAAVSSATWAVVVVLALLPAAAMGATFAMASRCLWRVAAGQGLHRWTARSVRQVSAAMAVSALMALSIPPLIGAVLTAAAGVGVRWSLSLNAHQVILLLFAAVIWQLAAVLDDAAAVAVEHAQIV